MAPRSIALVGIDGSGKTTQAHLLAEALADRGAPARYRRNAGGRRWFGRLAGVAGRQEVLPPRAMLFVEGVLRWLAILRTLLRRWCTGELTVMDRYAACQFASIRARGGDDRRARRFYRLFPAPDITFFLAVDPGIAYERIERRGYDHEELDHLRASIAAYRALPEFDRFVVIDANGTPEQVQAALLDHLSFAPVRRSRARGLLVTGAGLIAAAGAVTCQLAEGF
ncbi:thymidylate kinase [Actinoplanes sp. N902-109]|uniref:dTMP kinase n=1 Tax=Actinoplanes sp. (strain N902-109) TaxID=649831 RepID=UPI0003295242|nr:thymidylate kinase [Actinoplanes sp. N902-109]AGL14899.1 thymidylate kinase [Actinoplanes sp. N902-109]